FNVVWNPLGNILASIRYAVARYGSLSRAYRGVGYATGGLIEDEGLYKLAEEGWPEWVIPTDPNRRTDAMKLLALAAKDIQGGKSTSGNKRPSSMKTPRNNDDDAMLRKVVERQDAQISQMQQAIGYLAQLVASTQNIEQQPKGFNTDDVSQA